MTGAEPSSHRPPAGPAVAARALLIGDWRSVLHPVEPIVLDGSAEAAALLALTRMVAESMRLQALGEVVMAWHQLMIAVSRLAPVMCRRSEEDGRLATLTPQPTTEPCPLLWAWEVSLAIWREQEELRFLRWLFAPDRLTPREQLIAACVEFLRWVWDDPRTWDSSTVDVDGINRGHGPSVLGARANRLRRFAEPTVRDLDVAVWKRAGGFDKLHAHALGRLAAGPREPWTRGNIVSARVPVRDGRLLAWQRAARRAT